MFYKFFRKISPATSGNRVHAMENSFTADLAAELLVAPTALMRLTRDDARVVVNYMQPHRIDEGDTFIKQGDTRHTDFMVLILDGEVTVENIVVSRTEPVTVTVLGRGSLVGEMGLLDGEPRSASCTASTQLRCAILSRQALEDLMDDNPLVGAKLMLAVALRIAERLRSNADKLKMYVKLTQAMQQEISHQAGRAGSAPSVTP
ncbi:MAG: cyclic nucleotide-binding domain-containing protein [Polaromonas sp.]|nr:cyclic nucleotide-binding domain-containing protein [Polaromonas sp.]